ncbi:MAG: ABC transporter substrate-binding protein [Acidimicrobiia bacterium]|nr:ABC transporter substrate-binding protein [Actinomycetota bacterium]NDD96612.1 ABC transporter substrate-binding protein [Actinomycetota bacterium]NDE58270.1 ABC transporter substrate-binding protein [Acidimicrobiia bacterium]NDE79842.1 ABC transporter substrate-binding protein [Actinomycetota bacterium]NDF32227.1 ABC transporter substrate-binding protein [Acidimicrobiia bacterium]
MRRNKGWKLAAGVVALSLAAVACGGDDGGSSDAPSTEAPATECAETTPVKLQLQWFIQAQFAGYFAAIDQGYYAAQCLDVTIVEGGVDIVPQQQLADGAVDFALSWVPKALASREAGADIVNIAQVFQRSGTLQVSFKDAGITSPADFKGKKIGNWGYGNEFEIFAALTKAGLDPAADVELVQQQFDMAALLAGDIDAAEAMTYNEYAQVLEAVNPDTGKLYTADDFNVVSYEDEGVGMLQDAIWASGARLADEAYRATAVKFVAASLQGWAYCRDNAQSCADIVVSKGSKLGASHQLWQMNEVNKLIWPAAGGAGMIDSAAWDRTAKLAQETKNLEGSTVLTAAPDAEAYTNDIVTEALALLEGLGVDTKGEGFAPIEVTLNEAGA